MMSRFSYTQTDKSGEKTVTTVNIPVFDETTFTARMGEIVAFESAIQDITLGAKYRRDVVLESPGLTAYPSSPAANREGKWLIQYHDNGNVQRKLTSEIGCADIVDADLRIVNSDDADLTHATWVAFVAAFEALVVAPVSGNNVTIEKITYVGRNN